MLKIEKKDGNQAGAQIKRRNKMSRWGKPIKNTKRTNPRYFLNESERVELQGIGSYYSLYDLKQVFKDNALKFSPKYADATPLVDEFMNLDFHGGDSNWTDFSYKLVDIANGSGIESEMAKDLIRGLYAAKNYIYDNPDVISRNKKEK